MLFTLYSASPTPTRLPRMNTAFWNRAWSPCSFWNTAGVGEVWGEGGEEGGDGRRGGGSSRGRV